MVQLIIGSLLLSFIHVFIPNHWLPMVLLSRSEKWNNWETMKITGISAFAHALSTIALGIVVGLIGHKLSESYHTLTGIVAPLILIFMGIIYFGLDLKHSNHEHFPSEKKLQSKSKRAIIVSLFIAMFFSPCLEIETYFFMAGTYGWVGIATVSLIYLIISVTGMMILVSLGCKGIEKFNWHFLEHHEKKITGIILLVLGILSFFINH